MAMTEKPTGFATLQLAMDAIRRHEEAKRRAPSSCPVIKPIAIWVSLRPRNFTTDTPMRIFNLCQDDFVCPHCGKANGACPVPTPTMAQYENRWEII